MYISCKQCPNGRYVLGEWFCTKKTTKDIDGTDLWETVGWNGFITTPDWCPLIIVEGEDVCRVILVIHIDRGSGGRIR